MKNTIPIKNIYYMLCYAWDRLEQRDIVEIDNIEGNEIFDLFARILINGINYLIKKGFHRQYTPYNEEINVVKGRININESIKMRSHIKGKLYCKFDELTYNVLYNQILKTTIYNLLGLVDLDNNLKGELTRLYRYFHVIDRITINKKKFSEVQINRNNQYYSFLLDICEIIHDNLFVSESSGEVKFKDFIRDEKQMAYVFENFVRNFYKRELIGSKVYRENIKWSQEEGDNLEYLPTMQTDISVEIGSNKMIMDTKYKKDAFGYNYDVKKLHSENLYQIFAYLKNIKVKGGINENCVGVLLYPKTGEELNLQYTLQGEKIQINTIDLDQDWQLIHERLVNIALLSIVYN